MNETLPEHIAVRGSGGQNLLNDAQNMVISGKTSLSNRYSRLQPWGPLRTFPGAFLCSDIADHRSRACPTLQHEF